MGRAAPLQHWGTHHHSRLHDTKTAQLQDTHHLQELLGELKLSNVKQTQEMLVTLLERYVSIDAGVWLHGFKFQLPAQGISKISRLTSLFSVSLTVKMDLIIVTPICCEDWINVHKTFRTVPATCSKHSINVSYSAYNGRAVLIAIRDGVEVTNLERNTLQ